MEMERDPDNWITGCVGWNNLNILIMELIEKFIQSKIIGQYANEVSNPFWKTFPMSVEFLRKIIEESMKSRRKEVIIKCSSMGMAYLNAIDRPLIIDGNIWRRGYKFVVDAEINFEDQERYIFGYRDEVVESEWSENKWVGLPSLMDIIDKAEPIKLNVQLDELKGTWIN